MFTSVRVSSVVATLVVFVLILSQVAIVSVSANQESAASSSDREKLKSNKSKKRKKRQTPHSTAPFLVVTPRVTQRSTVTPAPVTTDVNGASEAVSMPVAQTARGSSRAARIPGTRISPIAPNGIGGIPPSAGQIIISEFRLFGLNVSGANSLNDQFIELYNNSGAEITVSALTGTGLGVAASDGVTRCTVPNGTVIPAGGHYLCVNSVGYTLGAYPAGNGTTATGDATYTTAIPISAGIALFNNDTGGASYSLANRLDAVGPTSEANALYKEGTGIPPVSFAVNGAFYRDTCGKGGSITTMGACTRSTPKDTDDNSADFIFMHTLGFDIGAGPRLGGPGPENLSSPIQRNAAIPATLLDPCATGASAPNRVRDFTQVTNGAQGTLDIRRTFTNNTGAPITRLRYRIVDITTSEAPSGFADLRAITSLDVPVTVDRAPCGSGTSSVTVTGTTLEEQAAFPHNNLFGGGFNTSLSSGSITLATPLANGASIDIRWVFGIEQTGLFKIYVNIEALP